MTATKRGRPFKKKYGCKYCPKRFDKPWELAVHSNSAHRKLHKPIPGGKKKSVTAEPTFSPSVPSAQENKENAEKAVYSTGYAIGFTVASVVEVIRRSSQTFGVAEGELAFGVIKALSTNEGG